MTILYLTWRTACLFATSGKRRVWGKSWYKRAQQCTQGMLTSEMDMLYKYKLKAFGFMESSKSSTSTIKFLLLCSLMVNRKSMYAFGVQDSYANWSAEELHTPTRPENSKKVSSVQANTRSVLEATSWVPANEWIKRNFIRLDTMPAHPSSDCSAVLQQAHVVSYWVEFTDLLHKHRECLCPGPLLQLLSAPLISFTEVASKGSCANSVHSSVDGLRLTERSYSAPHTTPRKNRLWTGRLLQTREAAKQGVTHKIIQDFSLRSHKTRMTWKMQGLSHW